MKDLIQAFLQGHLRVQHPFHARDYFSVSWPRDRWHFDRLVCARYRLEVEVLRDTYPELAHWRDDELVAVWEDWSQLCGQGWLLCCGDRDVFFLGMVFLRCQMQGRWPLEWSSVHHFARGSWLEELGMLKNHGVDRGDFRNGSMVEP